MRWLVSVTLMLAGCAVDTDDSAATRVALEAAWVDLDGAEHWHRFDTDGAACSPGVGSHYGVVSIDDAFGQDKDLRVDLFQYPSGAEGATVAGPYLFEPGIFEGGRCELAVREYAVGRLRAEVLACDAGDFLLRGDIVLENCL